MSEVEIISDSFIAGHDDAGTAASAEVYPSICQLRDGQVLCMYRAGAEKHSRDGKLVLQRSRDSGVTWGRPEVLFDRSREIHGESVHCGVIAEASDGMVIAMFTAVPIQRADESYIFSAEGRRLEQRFYICESADGGQNWSDPRKAMLPGSPPLTYIGSRPVVLPNGDLLVAVEVTTAAGLQEIMTARYDVRQRLFSDFQRTACDPSGELNFGDPQLLVRDDGSVLMITWTFDSAEKTIAAHALESMDCGSTWTSPVPTQVACQKAALASVSATQYLLAANVRVYPDGIRMWASHDSGKTWDLASELQMWDPGSRRVIAASVSRAAGPDPTSGALWDSLPGFTFGSPDLIRLHDGRMLLAFYAIESGRERIRACIFWPHAISGRVR